MVLLAWALPGRVWFIGSHKRSLSVINLLSNQTSATHFKGMTAEPIEAEVLLDIHERLLARVAGWLDEPSCAFLRSVEDQRPNFGLIGLLHAADLPGVRRKLHNLAQRTDAKRAADRSLLEETLAQIVDAR